MYESGCRRHAKKGKPSACTPPPCTLCPRAALAKRQLQVRVVLTPSPVGCPVISLSVPDGLFNRLTMDSLGGFPRPIAEREVGVGKVSTTIASRNGTRHSIEPDLAGNVRTQTIPPKLTDATPPPPSPSSEEDGVVCREVSIGTYSITGSVKVERQAYCIDKRQFDTR